MNEYKRLSYYLDDNCTMLAMPQRKSRIELYVTRLAELEDKIERGELRVADEVRKETAREILQKFMDAPTCKHPTIATGWFTFGKEYVKKLAAEYGVEVGGNDTN